MTNFLAAVSSKIWSLYPTWLCNWDNGENILKVFIHSIFNSFEFRKFCNKNFSISHNVSVTTWPEENNRPTFSCGFYASKLFEYFIEIETFHYVSLCSSEAEHWSRKPGVVGSIPTGGNTYCFAFQNILLNLKWSFH